MAVPPTFVTSNSSAFNVATSSVAVPVTTVAGDLLVAIGATADRSVTTISSITAPGVTYTQKRATINNSFPYATVQFCTAASTGSLTTTFTATNATSQIGGAVLVFRNFTAPGLDSSVQGSVAASASGIADLGGPLASDNNAGVFVNVAKPGGGGGSRALSGNCVETQFSSSAAWNIAIGYSPDLGLAATPT